jgi:D-alanyl-D-alanine carboxypeptidase
MLAQAKQDGISLVICSAYRPESRQEELFQSKTQEYIAAGRSEEEAIAVAATIVAKPGTSEHQTGLAIDIVTETYTNLDDGYAETPAAQWLAERAWEFGFALRYPKDKTEITKIIFEPWHYRYVGEENARIMKERGFCLEEYIDYLNEANA